MRGKHIPRAPAGGLPVEGGPRADLFWGSLLCKVHMRRLTADAVIEPRYAAVCPWIRPLRARQSMVGWRVRSDADYPGPCPDLKHGNRLPWLSWKVGISQRGRSYRRVLPGIRLDTGEEQRNTKVYRSPLARYAPKWHQSISLKQGQGVLYLST